MKRLLMLVPEGLTFDMLTEEQQAAINSVFGQYVMPMPDTNGYDGFKICDAVCTVEFEVENMADLGLDWQIIGQWVWNGENGVTEITPLDEQIFMNYLLDTTVYDGDGNQMVTIPAVFHEPHKWSGWPDCFDV